MTTRAPFPPPADPSMSPARQAHARGIGPAPPSDPSGERAASQSADRTAHVALGDSSPQFVSFRTEVPSRRCHHGPVILELGSRHADGVELGCGSRVYGDFDVQQPTESSRTHDDAGSAAQDIIYVRQSATQGDLSGSGQPHLPGHGDRFQCQRHLDQPGCALRRYRQESAVRIEAMNDSRPCASSNSVGVRQMKSMGPEPPTSYQRSQRSSPRLSGLTPSYAGETTTMS